MTTYTITEQFPIPIPSSTNSVVEEAQKEVSPVKGAASESDTLTREFLSRLKGYEKVNGRMSKVGVYVGGSYGGLVIYCFSTVEGKVFSIDGYWPNYEAGYLRKHEENSGAKSPCYPFRNIKKSSKGRFLQIKDLETTEIEYKHLIKKI